MAEEQYIYLGSMNTTHFFLHKIESDDFKPETSHQIYNAMIAAKTIENSTENVIIYETNNGVDYDCISIQHDSQEKFLRFNKENLQEMFKAMTTRIIDHIYVILYDYTQDRFESRKSDQKLDMSSVTKNETKINDIKYISTMKKIE